MTSSYFSLGIAPAPFKADVDLEAQQWHLVSAASSHGNVKIATGGCNPFPLGVLTNSPSAGQEATVVLLGTTKCMVRANACQLIQGRFLTPASNAVLEPLAVGTCPVFGRYLGPTSATVGASFLANVFVHPIVAGSVSGS